VVRDSKGTDFWLAFPPTQHPTSQGESLLAVFVSADQTTNVTIVARNRQGQRFTINNVVNAGTIGQFDFDVDAFESRSADFPTGPLNDCERVMPTSVHVMTDVDVAVYAVVRDLNTSDAWMVLPTDALGTDHRILTYSSDAVADTAFIVPRFSRGLPSQFLLVGTVDGTTVNIDLNPGRSRSGPGSSRSITLDQGQSYLVQAAVTVTDQNDDMTGSRIRSNKPLAVISSHYRAQVPILNDDASRDVLVEQVPSIDTWGKRFVVPPLQPPDDAVRQGQTDVTLIRILAHHDSTEVTVEGLGTIPLLPGRIWELPLSNGRNIQATQPILVAIIDRSANRNITAVNRTGDPSLIIVPPVEQYLSGYRLISIEPRAFGLTFYHQHLLTMTAPLSAGASLRVDGQPVPALTAIGTSGLGYVTVEVPNGQHDISADSLFGVIAYGYGPAESYGYTGGMAFERLYQPSIVLRVLDVHVAPGEEATIHIVVDSIAERASLIAFGVQRIAGEVEHDRTMFVPRTGAPRTSEVRGRQSFSSTFTEISVGDTVASISGTAVLGHAETDSLYLYSVEWANEFGEPVTVPTTTVGGELRTDSVCRATADPRLFDPFASVPMPVRVFDLLGRQRPNVGPGWNIILPMSPLGRTERRYVHP
jgi:hypothetical protein